jgi:hypothetical protein
MATITKAELRDRVLRHLKVLAAGESATAEDAGAVESAIDDVYEELGELGHAYWSADTIPQACARPLMRIVAADVAADFVTQGEADDYEVKRAPAMSELRAILAEPNDGAPIQVCYF